jgi:hypothetical protein
MTNGDGSTVDVGALRRHYRQDPGNKALYDYLAERKYSRSAITVDVLAGKTGLGRGQVVAFFKRLEELGCGRFVVGRGGHPSRFAWKVALADVGRAAAGQEVEVTNISEEDVGGDAAVDEDESESGELLEHVYRLRPQADGVVAFKLPADLTDFEAGKLADYIRTLPFKKA